MIDKRGGLAFAINGMEDHLHVLAKLRQDKSLSDVIRDLKAGATGWMHDVFPALEDFAWQKGYGAFTVSQSQVNESANTSRTKRCVIRTDHLNRSSGDTRSQ